jgi:hypothetical protein
MSYIITSPQGTYYTLRDAVLSTGHSDHQIRKACRTPNSGWSMTAHGSRRDSPNYATTKPWVMPTAPRAPKPPIDIAPVPVAPAHTAVSVELLTELRALRSEVASLRGEVNELTAQALNALTLPPGTQLNLPLTH